MKDTSIERTESWERKAAAAAAAAAAEPAQQQHASSAPVLAQQRWQPVLHSASEPSPTPCHVKLPAFSTTPPLLPVNACPPTPAPTLSETASTQHTLFFSTSRSQHACILPCALPPDSYYSSPCQIWGTLGPRLPPHAHSLRVYHCLPHHLINRLERRRCSHIATS